MKFRWRKSSPMDDSVCDRGSVVVETAILMPFVIIILLFFVRLFQILCVQNCVEYATLRAAEELRKYGIIYHTYGVSRLEDTLLKELNIDVLDSFIDLRGYVEEGDDALYEAVTAELVEHYLQQDPLVKNGYVKYSGLSCKGSAFFNRNEDIELCVRCSAYSFVRVGTSVRFRTWVRGDSPTVSLTESGVSVWTFNNFTRGRILRDIFGGELPYDYPVIASFKEGVALMIKSIDITKTTYQDPQRLSEEIREMIDKLANFKGTENMTGVDSELRISEASIKQRKLLLIFPTNRMTPEQTAAISNVLTSYSVIKNVQVEMQFFQESPERPS